MSFSSTLPAAPTAGVETTASPRPVRKAAPRSGARGLVLPLLAAAALGYAVWHVTGSSQSMPQTEPPVVPPRAPFAGGVAGVGLVEPCSENIEVAAIVPGTVAAVDVRVGDLVDAGAPLFRLDDRQRRTELAIAKAELVEAEATLDRWQQMPRAEDLPPSAAKVERYRADLALRDDQLRRARQLIERKAITEQELVAREQAASAARADLAQAEAEDARLRAGAWKADVAVARAQVERCRERVEQMRVELDRLVVRAPIRSTVLKVDVRPGEYVGTPPGRALAVLGDVETLHVRVDVDENDLPRFEPGAPGRGYVRGDAETPLPLRFVRVEPFTEPKTSLTGAGNERIDTRVLQVIYAIESTPRPVYVGQQLEIFLDGSSKRVAERSKP